MDWEPAVGWVPLQAPEAVQAVALVEFQVRTEAEPALTDVGVALRETVGAGVGVGVGPKKDVTSRYRDLVQ